LEVLDKGKAPVITIIIETCDKNTRKVVFENQSMVFICGAGGFGGKHVGNDAHSFFICHAHLS